MAELAKPDNYLDSQAKQVLRQLVAEMANEMRTQIGRILGFSQVMLEPEEVGTLNEEQRKYLTTIYQAGQNLLKILNDSVDTLHLAVGRLHLEIAEVDLNHLLWEVISAAPDRIQQSIQSNLPVIWADRLRVQQAVTMILSRAVYAASPRNESTVKLTVCCDDNWVCSTSPLLGKKSCIITMTPMTQPSSSVAPSSRCTAARCKCRYKRASSNWRFRLRCRFSKTSRLIVIWYNS